MRERRELERWHRRRSLARIPTIDAANDHAPDAGASEWRECDFVWEQCQEQAGLAYRAKEVSTPPRLWRRGLAIAERWFARGDPRLATSLTNQALVLRRRGQVPQAEQMFARALEVWDESWRWVGLMSPPPGAAAGYDREARAAFNALIAHGRAATAALEHYDRLPESRLELWLELRPRHPDDLRKLLGAVFLMVCEPD